MKYFIIFFLFPIVTFGQSPIHYVNPLIGTAPSSTPSARKNSITGSELRGQNIPAIGRPFGMTQWTPETRTTEQKCTAPYYYNDQYITGFRGSHWMSGSCTQDYGSVTLMPFTATAAELANITPQSNFSHKTETVSPAYYRVLLNNYNILVELTGSVRSGMMRFCFPKGKESFLSIRVNSDYNQGKIEFDPKRNEIFGYNPVHRIYQGWGQSAGFSGWFVIRFDKPFKIIHSNNTQQMVINFENGKTVQVQIGTSFTSRNAACNNLNQEIKDWNFDQLKKETEDIWNQTLNKIKVNGGTDKDLIKFYTALYHCYQLPRIASDIDGSYQGFAQDTLIHKAIGFDYYDDFSMWDTYRALHPLMAILEPKRSLDMVKSLIAKAEQGGWMPIFPAWGNYTAAMIGDHVSTMIADSYCRGIKDFDVEKAYLYMHQNAFSTPSLEAYKDGKGRRALSNYLKYGYIPLEDSVLEAFHICEQVSRTMEYAFDDYALAQFAKAIGKAKDYQLLMKRALNYRNVFDTQAGYVRGRYADGHWVNPFNPKAKTSYICEGTPFQYTWYVPQDIPGLIDLMGGKVLFLKKLNKFFDEGYYWHGNEPDQQAAYLFTLAGNPIKTQEWVRRIIEEEYGTDPGGISGNEDAGQMSAWLVCSMMGFYPVCPGKPEYVLGYPSFSEIKIDTESTNKPFIILTHGVRTRTSHIDKIQRNGKPLTNYILQHKWIVSGEKIILNIN